MVEQTPEVEQAGVEVLDLGRANQAHVHLHLVLEQLHGAVDAVEAVRRHGVQEGAADADALGAEAERLEDVGAATDATVNVNLDLVLQAELAEDGHGLGENLDGGAGELELATAMVGEDDTLHANLDGLEHVLNALDALEDDGHLGDALEPGDVLPAEGGVDEGADGTGGTLVTVCLLTLLDVRAVVGELDAHVLLTAAELGRIDGNEESLAAALLGVLDDALGDGAVLVDVELKPLDLITFGGVHDLVKGARGEGGDHLDDVVLLGGASEEDLTLDVAELAKGSGSDVEGNIDLGSEHGGAEVDVLDIDQDLGAEPDAVESGVVFAKGLRIT